MMLKDNISYKPTHTNIFSSSIKITLFFLKQAAFPLKTIMIIPKKRKILEKNLLLMKMKKFMSLSFNSQLSKIKKMT